MLGEKNFEKLIKLNSEIFPGFEASVTFTRENNQLKMSPCFQTQDMTVDKMVMRLREYAAACDHLANDIETKTSFRKNNRLN